MGISIGIKEFIFPKWVEDIYRCMTEEDRARNTKANIYGLCSKTDDGYEISPFISQLSNRSRLLPEAKDVAIAFALADNLYPWSYLPGATIKTYTCNHCGFKFDSPQKDPQCPFCHKWEWEQALKG